MEALSPTTVCVIGLGYVGLPTAALLAKAGYTVKGVDIQQSVVDTINAGSIHIIEGGLLDLVREVVRAGTLSASTRCSQADMYIIAVPTPLKDDYIPDIGHVRSAVESIAEHVKPGNLVILESTSPVGTTEMIASIFAEKGIDASTIHLAYCPERILPGLVLKELIENDRIIGGLTESAGQKAQEFYKTFVSGDVIVTDSRTAEMTKLVENAYRNVNIAFANELSMICDTSNVNVWDVIRLANRHPRVNVLRPGPGVGGHCIAVDPLFITHKSREDSQLIQTSHRRNQQKTKWVLEKIRKTAYEFINTHHRPPVIACLGITYKPDIDDIRESPSLFIVKQLLAEGYAVLTVDPHAGNVNGLQFASLEAALCGADIFVVLVAHSAFRNTDFSPEKRLLDVCGLTQI